MLVPEHEVVIGADGFRRDDEAFCSSPRCLNRALLLREVKMPSGRAILVYTCGPCMILERQSIIDLGDNDET